MSGGGSGGPAGKGHTGKHSGSKKHHVNHHHKHHPKHKIAHHHVHHKAHVHTKGKGAHHPRGYALGDLLPVCTFEALAMSLRLAGQPVAEDDLLELWWLAGAREVSIAEALDAAARFGLAGCRPIRQQRLNQLDVDLGGARPVQVAHPDELHQVVDVHALILGVDLPGPHAVLATPDGWWSWGGLHSPWTAAIEEAWVVSWQ